MASAAITCAPPTNRPKSSVPFPVPNKTASQITRPAIHMGARRAHLPTPTRPKFFTHADATRTPPPRRQRHATPTPPSLAHTPTWKQAITKVSKAQGPGPEHKGKKKKAPSQEQQPQISAAAARTGCKIWPCLDQTTRAWIWINNPTKKSEERVLTCLTETVCLQ